MGELLAEIRLLLCGYCFSLALWLAPRDNAEGQRIIDTLLAWGIREKELMFYKSVKDKK